MTGERPTRVFVANRGEIALRIVEACDRLGFESVVGVSTADRHTLAARRATRVVVLGPASAAQSYLNQNAVVHAAIETQCTAVHPGYGFLSERADFARLCAENYLTFIGATPEQLETLGDKLSARRFAESVGVPVSPGGPTSTLDEARALAEKIGYPSLVKAAFGGGGRGMKLVESSKELDVAWTLASSEAQASFGDGSVFIERFVRSAKHIEVQILGDGHGNCVHLAERECSLQYRYQKMIEEAPSVALTEEDRTRLHEYALRIARGLGYRGLGTVEFLYDVDKRDIRFLEVNPRVQVEHPVTEAVTGVDLVREQILVALGAPVSFTQEDVRVTGHAVELRLTAQDPDRGLHPSPGPLTRWRPGALGGVRWDTHMYEGYQFPPFYDALMAKIVAFGEDRDTALRRARAAIAGLKVDGLKTNAGLLARLLVHPAITENRVTTLWLEGALGQGELSA
jgi:acetyl-CoA carboxylase biotin carboxylase subunit